MSIDNIAVVIPAYKPDEKLIATLDGLVQTGFKKIIVINDGSGEEFNAVFEKVTAFDECVLLTHEKNRGKGAGLKTAFSYFLENLSDMQGVVCADADGQHLTKDIISVSEKMIAEEKIILGCRDFSEKHVPPRSRFGNKMTSGVFKLFFGMTLSDTQTGLRAFPTKYISDMCKAEGDRYEYETNMLFLMNKLDIPYDEVKISTVYIEENKSSHFRVVRDSIRIYSLILKYLFSAVVAFTVDILLYHFLHVFGVFNFIPLPTNVVPQITARVVSSFVNYLVNAKVVFKDDANAKTVTKYYLLAAIQLAVGTIALTAVSFIFSIPENSALSTFANLIIQMIIYPLSFRIQHKWVFNSKK